MEKILTIDDKKNNLTAIRARLEDMFPGCEVLTAQSGINGIKIAKERLPDVILLDIIMPDMNGFDVCKLLKSDKIVKHIPVILITAIQTDINSRIKGLESGADAFLTMPITAPEFFAQLNAMLRIKKAEDILRTEKRNLETLTNKQTKRLYETEEKFKTLIETIEEGIGNVDENENFIYVNKTAANIFGYSKEEMTGKNLKELTSPEMFRKVLDQSSIRKKEKTSKYELTIIRKNGEKRIITITSTPIIDNEGNYKGAFGIFHDISERKQAEDNLKQALKRAEESDRLKSAFLATMSHELRTPLNGIIGFSEILVSSDLSEDEIKDFANSILSSGNNLLQIVNDIIDISLIEADEIKISKEKFYINKTLKDIHTTFINYDKIQNNQIDIIINYELEEGEDIIYTDETKFRQIINNLIKNAFKFTHQGTIEFGYTVKTENDIPFLQFYVKDTGIGIPEDKQSIIFERFRQADDSHTRKYGGIGLGLAITEKLLKLLGGKIWVESEEGKGSTFFFTLPFDPDEKPISTDTKAEKIFYDWKDKTILVVEDNIIVYQFIELALRKTKACLLWTKRGKDAISTFKSSKEIDLVLMDIQLPDINGYEVTKQLKKINKDIPVIAQTAFALEGDKEKSLEAGCDDYITKPIKPKKLLSLIDKYLK
jgi:PAS domain S-box-containing protein